MGWVGLGRSVSRSVNAETGGRSARRVVRSRRVSRRSSNIRCLSASQLSYGSQSAVAEDRGKQREREKSVTQRANGSRTKLSMTRRSTSLCNWTPRPTILYICATKRLRNIRCRAWTHRSAEACSGAAATGQRGYVGNISIRHPRPILPHRRRMTIMRQRAGGAVTRWHDTN